LGVVSEDGTALFGQDFCNGGSQCGFTVINMALGELR
jgi:hypothetical protein